MFKRETHGAIRVGQPDGNIAIVRENGKSLATFMAPGRGQRQEPEPFQDLYSWGMHPLAGKA